VSEINRGEEWSTHSSRRLVEARSLAMHVEIARKIERDPQLFAIAHDNVARWAAQRTGQLPAWLNEWREILQRPWRSIAALITDPGVNAARLRRSSPFAGVLSNQERWQIYKDFQTCSRVETEISTQLRK